MMTSGHTSGIARAAMFAGLLGAFASDHPMGHRTPRYERPPGRPGIKKYRIKRKARNRMALASRRRNRT